MPTIGLASGLVMDPRLSASPLAKTLPDGVTTHAPWPVGVAAAAATFVPLGADVATDVGTPSRTSTTLPPTTTTDDDGDVVGNFTCGVGVLVVVVGHGVTTGE